MMFTECALLLSLRYGAAVVGGNHSGFYWQQLRRPLVAQLLQQGLVLLLVWQLYWVFLRVQLHAFVNTLMSLGAVARFNEIT